MNNSQLDRVMRILARTGDRCMVFDRQNDVGVMVMNLDEYEKFLNGGQDVSDLSEGDMLEKINRDIAVWRENHASEEGKSDVFDWDFEKKEEPKIDFLEPEEEGEDSFAQADFEAEKPLDLAENEPNLEVEKPLTEVDLSDVPKDDEEEKFYLEPVE